MKTLCPTLILAVLLMLLSGCVTVPPKDYTAFRQYQPKSILVLPPQNQSTDINAGYSLLTTTTRPLSEMGYYVFPVVMVDQLLKENGLPSAAEMHEAPLDKLHEVFGADAVLYITVEKYGSKYMVLSTTTFVHANAKLVDCKTGTILWNDRVMVQLGGNSSSDPIAALVGAVVDQVVNKMVDQAHNAAYTASAILFTNPNTGLLKGPRHPAFGQPTGTGASAGPALIR
jgi:hypothetical protein